MRRQSASEVKRRKTTRKKNVEAAVGKALSRAGFGA